MFHRLLNMEVVYFVLTIFVISVNSVAIHGPMHTRYNPCSLGVIYFDKITNVSWQGTINFSLYPNITDAEIEVNFDKPMRIFGVSHAYYRYVRCHKWSSVGENVKRKKKRAMRFVWCFSKLNVRHIYIIHMYR